MLCVCFLSFSPFYCLFVFLSWKQLLTTEGHIFRFLKTLKVCFSLVFEFQDFFEIFDGITNEKEF